MSTEDFERYDAVSPPWRGESALQSEPAAEVAIDVPLVERLVAKQFPEFSEEPVAFAGEGWDNANFRVGSEHAARLPRREIAVGLLQKELRWLTHIEPLCSLRVPALVGRGRPMAGYPWEWSLVRWVPGEAVGHSATGSRMSAARTLGAFTEQLHAPAPVDAPRNPYRGVPLGWRTESVADWLSQVAEITDVDAVRAVWREAVHAPAHAGPEVWVHGDLHPFNIVAQKGGISGVIDFGDLCSGDPAVDLALGWLMFEPAERAEFLRLSGADSDAVARGRGWAVFFGLTFLSHGARRADYRALGQLTLARVLAKS